MFDSVMKKAGKDPALKYLVWAIYAGLAVAIVVVIYKIYQAYKAGSGAAGDILGTQINAAQTGVDASRVQVCKEVAKSVRDNITNFGIFKYLNEGGITDALNRLATDKEAALTSAYFRQNTGWSLKSSITAALFNGWQSKINPVILNNLT